MENRVNEVACIYYVDLQIRETELGMEFPLLYIAFLQLRTIEGAAVS